MQLVVCRNQCIRHVVCGFTSKYTIHHYTIIYNIIYICIYAFFVHIMYIHVDTCWWIWPPEKNKTEWAPKLPKTTWPNVSNSKVLSEFPVFVIPPSSGYTCNILEMDVASFVGQKLYNYTVTFSLTSFVDLWFEVTWRPQMLGCVFLSSPPKKTWDLRV